MLPILIGIAIIAAAATILVRRAHRFFKTEGQSVCANCPYSGSCGGDRCKTFS